MGMLFNTANTAKILQMLDNYFGPGQLTNLNANDFLHWPLATGTYNYLADKGLYFPNDQTLDQKMDDMASEVRQTSKSKEGKPREYCDDRRKRNFLRDLQPPKANRVLRCSR